MQNWKILLAVVVLNATPSFAQQNKRMIDNAYQDQSGNLIVQFAYGVQQSTFYYGDAKGLYQLDEKGFGGTRDRYSMSFNDPRLKESGRFFAGVDPKDIFKNKDDFYELDCDGRKVAFTPLSRKQIEELEAKLRDKKMPVAGLPKDVYRTEYLLKEKGSNRHIYVEAPEYDFSYDGFRLYVGEPGKMTQLKIKDVVRFRDGGTTTITTVDGQKLYVPTPAKPELSPKWNDLYELEAARDDFDLKTLKIAGVPSEPAKLRTPCDPLFPQATGGAPGEKSGKGSAGSADEGKKR